MSLPRDTDAPSSPDWPLWLSVAALGLVFCAGGVFFVLALPLEIFGPLHPFIAGVFFYATVAGWSLPLGLVLAWLATRHGDSWRRWAQRLPLQRRRLPEFSAAALAPWRGFLLFAFLSVAGGGAVIVVFAATLVAAAAIPALSAWLARTGIPCPRESDVQPQSMEEVEGGVSFFTWLRARGRGLARQLVLGMATGALARAVAALFAPDAATAYGAVFAGGFTGVFLALLLGIALPFPKYSTLALAPVAADLLCHGQAASALAFLLGAGVLAGRRLHALKKETGSWHDVLPWAALQGGVILILCQGLALLNR